MYFQPLGEWPLRANESHSAHCDWSSAAAVIYAWTDRRQAVLDRDWWRNQPSQLQLDVTEAKAAFAEFASRSSCRRHASLVRDDADGQRPDHRVIVCNGYFDDAFAG